MPSTYEIDPARQLATITSTGDVTGKDFIDALLAVTADPAWQRDFDRLWNGKGIRTLDMTPDQFFRIIALEKDEATCARRTAIVVKTDEDLVAAKAHSVHMLRSYPTEIFLTVEEALAWLEKPTIQMEA